MGNLVPRRWIPSDGCAIVTAKPIATFYAGKIQAIIDWVTEMRRQLLETQAAAERSATPGSLQPGLPARDASNQESQIMQREIVNAGCNDIQVFIRNTEPSG